MLFRFVVLIVLSPLFSLFAQNKQLIGFPKQWEFLVPKHGLILTSDRQLRDLQDPDKKINTSLGYQPEFKSLRQVRDEAVAMGCHTVMLAFDNFFRQYRNDVGDERNLLPDSDEYIRLLQNISRFLQQKNLGLELSLLSPLEQGPAFSAAGGEPGRWVHYKTELRDPQTGRFSVSLWEQLAWSNNKGKFRLQRSGVRAFAYKGKDLANGSYTAVRPEDIKEITSGIKIEEYEGTTSPDQAGYRSRRIRIFHDDDQQLQGLDRVFVVLRYITPEMDYFSARAPLFLRNLLDKYYKAGINLSGLYSDEMHIQQDWSYWDHHDNGQFCLRYLTDNMAAEYARQYGQEFADMEKYMIYFVHGPRPYLNNTHAILDNQIVIGSSPQDLNTTFLFRDRYYRLLTNQVVDLFVSAKKYAEKLWQRSLPSRAHATWAESPTIDQWDQGNKSMATCQYEYTPNFVWSNTVQQAASACYDYFKWGDFLSGNGNDHCECGWLDRNYLAPALSASLGIINEYPNAYAGFWGMPNVCAERRQAIVDAYGGGATAVIQAVTENVHRDVDVLMLYPMDLVAADERFGSWMTQYGYANYITAEMLLQKGRVTADGKIALGGRHFSTLIALYEILPDRTLLDMMKKMIAGGGRVIWSGPPPLLAADGNECRQEWQALFGVTWKPAVFQGEYAAGKLVKFSADLSSLAPMTILTDFIVDRVYPVQNSDGRIVAQVNNQTVGVARSNGKGLALYLGFRPRDDQSASLGEESRVWFEILSTLAVYSPSGAFKNTNDNTEYLSRTTDFLCTRFPNGTTIVTNHYRRHEESWPSGFSRNNALDDSLLKLNPPPSDRLHINGFKVNGHEASYDGQQIMAFRTDKEHRLLGFYGRDCDRVTIDGQEYIFSDHRLREIGWTPVAPERKLPHGADLQFWLQGAGTVAIPLPDHQHPAKLYLQGSTPGSRGQQVSFVMKNGKLEININQTNSGKWMYLVMK
jgi:hypothetical protein